MENVERLKAFYQGKKVFVTGHTGFKGTWLCGVLHAVGANVTGYALAPVTGCNLFDISGVEKEMCSVIGDVRDLSTLKKAMASTKPEIVIHMAAQPLVRTSYEQPVYTYETNVMGTVHILEAIRGTDSVRSFVNVTTDKVYKNNEWDRGYVETDELNGYDPYSNSKSCSELVTDSYKKSFFQDREIAVSTVRAGNVIGGGDFSKDRIVPDCVKAAIAGEIIKVRNPYSIRPYQHVLEPLFAYLVIAKRQYEDKKLMGNYNVGPHDEDCVTTGELVSIFCETWGNVSWRSVCEKNAVHEANFLKLDCAKIRNILGISPRWSIRQAIEKTVEWTKCYVEQSDVALCMRRQIEQYAQKEMD